MKNWSKLLTITGLLTLPAISGSVFCDWGFCQDATCKSFFCSVTGTGPTVYTCNQVGSVCCKCVSWCETCSCPTGIYYGTHREHEEKHDFSCNDTVGDPNKGKCMSVPPP